METELFLQHKIVLSARTAQASLQPVEALVISNPLLLLRTLDELIPIELIALTLTWYVPPLARAVIVDEFPVETPSSNVVHVDP